MLTARLPLQKIVCQSFRTARSFSYDHFINIIPTRIMMIPMENVTVKPAVSYINTPKIGAKRDLIPVSDK